MSTTFESNGKNGALLHNFHAWKLGEAKAKFSELVREAQEKPQRVTVDGQDAVMIVSVEMFSSLLPPSEQPDLHDLLQQSPLADVDFDFESVRSPVRDVEL